MKKYFSLLFLSFFVATNAVSQYHPMFVNSFWTISVTGASPQYYYSINQGADTTINGIVYKKVTENGTDLYFREDITNQRVYRFFNNQEFLEFDFSLVAGDHVILYGTDYVVDSVGIINVVGGTRKAINLLLMNGNTIFSSELWIEGVGNIGHPLRGNSSSISDPNYSLECSFQSGISVFNLGLAVTGTSSSCPILDTETFLFSNSNIQVVPNPLINTTTIVSKIPFKDASVILFNSLGEEISVVKNCNGQQLKIDCENLLKGLYLMKIVENDKVLAIEKLIISN